VAHTSFAKIKIFIAAAVGAFANLDRGLLTAGLSVSRAASCCRPGCCVTPAPSSRSLVGRDAAGPVAAAVLAEDTVHQHPDLLRIHHLPGSHEPEEQDPAHHRQGRGHGASHGEADLKVPRHGACVCTSFEAEHAARWSTVTAAASHPRSPGPQVRSRAVGTRCANDPCPACGVWLVDCCK